MLSFLASMFGKGMSKLRYVSIEVREAIARCVCHIAMILKDLGQILDEFNSARIGRSYLGFLSCW